MPTQHLSELKSEMQKSIDAYASQLVKIHTGRANPGLIEDIQVEVYGNMMPLKQVANISVPESQQLLVQPWDQGNATAIEKAITQSNLGFNPQNEGHAIRINIPSMTEERRNQLKKVIDEFTEKARIAIRSHRQDTIKEVKKLEDAKEISEDESRRLQDEIQKVTDAMNKTIDEKHEAKVKELTTV